MITASTDPRFDCVCQTVREQMKRLPVIPGVVVGVLSDGIEHVAGFGVTSVEYPTQVSPNTLFQVGSITKTFVATLIMQLVDQGKLDLDAPVRRYLPAFELGDAVASAGATLRHCLTHTGGWEGDYSDDFGNGDDALAQIVKQIRYLPQLAPLGFIWSYNNTGFYVAGRIIEVVTGQSFEAAMRRLIFDPLGLSHSYFFPDDVITRHFVVGHVPVDGKPQVARPWARLRATNAAGGIVTTVGDLFKYARFHWGDGTTASGDRLLTRASLEAMQTPAYSATDPQRAGIGFALEEFGKVRAFGHAGGTNGQITRFEVYPEAKIAVVVLTNSQMGNLLIDPVLKTAREAYLNFVPRPLALKTLAPAELSKYVGRYDSKADLAELRMHHGALILQITYKGGFPTPAALPPATQPLPVRVAIYGDDKLVFLDEPFLNGRAEFVRGADGQIKWLRVLGRLHERLAR